MPSFRVELETLPAEKIKNICDTISSNDRRFIGEFEATHLQLANKIRKLILFPSIYVLDLKKYPLVCQKTHSEVLEVIKSQIWAETVLPCLILSSHFIPLM